MIIDSEVILGLSVGQKTKAVQPGDSQIILPPVIQATVNTQLPVQFAPNATAEQTLSAVVSSNINRTNQARVSTEILTLGPGYWSITADIAAWFDWLHAVATEPDVIVYLTIGGVDFLFSNIYAIVGTQHRNTTYRFLTRDPMIITHEVSATTVAQHTDSTVFISATKLL